MNARSLSIILALTFLILILDLVRREKLTFKYASGWILVTLGGILAATFDQITYQIAARLGFVLTSNFIFFIVLCGMVFLSLILTIFLCQQNLRNDRMAQKIGILEDEIKRRLK